MTWTVSASGYNSATAAAICTISIATPAVVTVPHTALANDKVVLSTTGALPTGLVAGTPYYLIAAGLTGNQFRVAATAGGAAINTSGTQSGVHTATFEHVIADDVSNATYWMNVSLGSMIGGDVAELRAYDQILASAAAAPANALAQIWKGSYAGPQINDHKSFPFLASDQRAQFTIKALANVYNFNPTFTNGSQNITAAANLLQLNDVVQFTTTGTLPTNFALLTNYWVVQTGSPFRVASNLGGGAITAGSAGSGTHTVTRIGHSFGFKLLRQ